MYGALEGSFFGVSILAVLTLGYGVLGSVLINMRQRLRRLEDHLGKEEEEG